jgi:hypothetical protein
MGFNSSFPPTTGGNETRDPCTDRILSNSSRSQGALDELPSLDSSSGYCRAMDGDISTGDKSRGARRSSVHGLGRCARIPLPVVGLALLSISLVGCASVGPGDEGPTRQSPSKSSASSAPGSSTTKPHDESDSPAQNGSGTVGTQPPTGRALASQACSAVANGFSAANVASATKLARSAADGDATWATLATQLTFVMQHPIDPATGQGPQETVQDSEAIAQFCLNSLGVPVNAD